MFSRPKDVPLRTPLKLAAAASAGRESLLRILIVALIAVAFPLRAGAEAEIDYSDLWWNPAESGWGMALQRQGDVMFAALYVYDAQGASDWYVASDVRPANSAKTSWSGSLYRTSGPGFAGAYDGAVTVDVAGSINLEFSAADSGVLTYTVRGVSTRRPVARMVLAAPALAGTYYGGITTLAEQCRDPNLDGEFELAGPLTVTQSGSHITLKITVPGVWGVPSTCTFNGDYRPGGRTGALSGNFACNIAVGFDTRGSETSGNVRIMARLGTFTIDGVSVNRNGLHGNLRAQDQNCAIAGRVGGVRLP
jgi:hypothetical protein